MRPDRLIPLPLRKLSRHFRCQIRYPPLSASEVAGFNTKEAYDLLYRRDDLLAQYLEPDRLAFYEEVADYCAELVERLQSPEPLRVADLGCGTGHLLSSLWQRLSPSSSLELWGLDYAPSAIERAKQLLPEAKLIVRDVYDNQLSSDYFDLVLCMETLEHLSCPERVVREMVRICSPFGMIVITVPNGAKDRWEGHVNFWAQSELSEFLSPYGVCEIVSVNNDRNLRALLLKGLTGCETQIPHRHDEESAEETEKAKGSRSP